MPALGEVDREGGEFWLENPFEILSSGNNLSAFEPNRMFLNIEGRDFLEVSFASAADLDSDSRAAIASDFDRDGAPDLLVGSVGGGPLRLFLNRFPREHRRVRLDLVGVESNRQAIGTRVVAEVAGRKIVRDLFPANGSTGQAPPELLVGLGQAERIDRLTLRWPTGKTQVLENLPVDVRITITEGGEGYETGPLAGGDSPLVR
jgi:hypothetical protein